MKKIFLSILFICLCISTGLYIHSSMQHDQYLKEKEAVIELVKNNMNRDMIEKINKRIIAESRINSIRYRR